MYTMNSNNFGLARGRLTRNPAVFTNTDGSRKVKFTLALHDNYIGKDGKRGCQFINFEGFLRADKSDNGVFDYIHEGDLVNVRYTMKTNTYKDKNNATVYSQVLAAQEVQIEETRRVIEARMARKAAEAAIDTLLLE